MGGVVATTMPEVPPQPIGKCQRAISSESTITIASILPEIERLWSESPGDPEICVAVLDGPVDLQHPCFAGARLKRLETLIPDVSKEGPAGQHGTHVASVILGQNQGSVRGVAPKCRGLIIPIFTDGPDGSISPCSQVDLARGIGQALENGAHVINISGGQLDPSGQAHPLLAGIIRQCAANNVLIVAAAGNNGCECLHVPAALPSVAVVGAMDSQGQPLESSNWGKSYHNRGILAAGENVPGASPGGGTVSRTGTSFATPIVSGVVALLLSIQLKRGRKPSPRAAWDAILDSAIGCSEQPVSDCHRLLAGRLNIVGALTQLTEGENMERSNQNPTTAVEDDHAHVTADAETMPAAGEQPPESTRLYRSWIEGPLDQCGIRSAAFVRTSVSETTGRITPSECACGGGNASLVYALGQLGHDFGSEARRDSFGQQGIKDPHDAGQLLSHLKANVSQATAVIWILALDATPIYAIRPAGPFAAETYERLREFLNAQREEGAERVSIPGVVSGKETLMNGQVVPVIYPELRGMYSWSTKALLAAVLGKAPAATAKEAERTAYQQKETGVQNFLERVYDEMRNLGLTSQERALNYAATNAFQVQRVYQRAIEEQTQLDAIEIEKSPVCRPGADCWDVKLTFFNPTRRLEQARKVYRFTIDVTDVVPVTVGTVRQWHIY